MDDRSLPDGPPPRRAGFQGSSFGDDRFGDDAFRDDRFDDATHRDAYAPLSDALAQDDRPLASPWTRLGAVVIDGLFYGAAVIPGVILMGLAGGFADETDGAGLPIALVLMGLGFLAAFGYNMWLLSETGQTLGKKALKLRVVDEADASNPGFVRAVLLRALAPGVIANVPVIGTLFSLADALFIFRDDRKCIHDHFAKTVVVTEAEGAYGGPVTY